jgi:ankyrin repeat protein
VDHEGQTPIFYAVKQGKTQCLDFLMQNCTIDFTRKDDNDHNLINIAQKHRKTYLVEKLIMAGVPCPEELKKKLQFQMQKQRSTRSKYRTGK